jgi:hypothetical protein
MSNLRYKDPSEGSAKRGDVKIIPQHYIDDVNEVREKNEKGEFSSKAEYHKALATAQLAVHRFIVYTNGGYTMGKKGFKRLARKAVRIQKVLEEQRKLQEGQDDVQPVDPGLEPGLALASGEVG